MHNFYICSIEVYAHHCTEIPCQTVYVLPQMFLISVGDRRWDSYAPMKPAKLLKNIDVELCTLLALVDPMFRKVTHFEMSHIVRRAAGCS